MTSPSLAPFVAIAVAVSLLAAGLATASCGSGACQQSPCVPGVPVLNGTCKCVPVDGGPAVTGSDADPG